MGKTMDKFLDMLGIGNDEEDDDFEYEDERESEDEIAATGTTPLKSYEAPRKSANVVDFASRAAMAMKLILVEPVQFDEVQKICDDLRNKKATIVNFEKADKETAQRMVDFMSGATYALNGNVKKVSGNIIVVAPQNVDILGSIKYTMEETNDEFDISQWLK